MHSIIFYLVTKIVTVCPFSLLLFSFLFVFLPFCTFALNVSLLFFSLKKKSHLTVVLVTWVPALLMLQNRSKIMHQHKQLFLPLNIFHQSEEQSKRSIQFPSIQQYHDQPNHIG